MSNTANLNKSSEETLQAQPFRFYFRKHPRVFFMGSLSLFCTNLLDVLTPLGVKFAIDSVTAKDSAKLLQAILIYIGLMAFVALFRFGWRYYFGRFHHTVAEDLRNRIFGKLTELGPSFYQRSPVGQLMSLMTNDVNAFRMAIGPGMLTLLDALFLLAMILPIMIWLSWDWTWKTLIFIPFIPFIMRKLEAAIHTRYREEQDRLAEVSANTQEIVSGVRVIKGFAQEQNQLDAFNVKSREYEVACNRVVTVDALFHPSFQGAIILGGVSLLWFGTPDVMRGTVTLGSFVAFHDYVRRMVWPFSAIGLAASMMEQGRASFSRIKDLLSTETDIPDLGDVTIEKFEKLEIKNLTFRYAGAIADALTDIDLTIEAGETIGIVGPVGSGKTTLLQVATRMYPAPGGTVRINGVDIERIRRNSLSHFISYVTQDVFLFSDTIAENVALGFTDFPGLEHVEEATAIVNIDQEIRGIPGSYGAYLGERGVNLSGGQKQRLTIARAMIRRSQVVILDDSLSAVDGRTEKIITRELRSAAEKRTVILVSHRLATLRHADRIIVMNQGRIEAIGSHKELLASSQTYRELDSMQNLQATPSPEASV
jgi:ATP-binding cassette, subfamily B, multidrug efflux pump